MPTVIQRPAEARSQTSQVTPSIVDPHKAGRFTLDQELEPFGQWVGEPIWAPPKDASRSMAKAMLAQTGPFTPRDKRWEVAIESHRDQCTQVREIELYEASIRLPKGRFFVSVLDQTDFDKIDDDVPACVQTRLEEFLAGPGAAPGVKVSYLKPL